MTKIIIIGAGAMGSAFTIPCIENGNDVTLIGTHLENDLIDEISKSQLVKFDLKQHKTHYKDWITSFENSIFSGNNNVCDDITFDSKACKLSSYKTRSCATC